MNSLNRASDLSIRNLNTSPILLIRKLENDFKSTGRASHCPTQPEKVVVFWCNTTTMAPFISSLQQQTTQLKPAAPKSKQNLFIRNRADHVVPSEKALHAKRRLLIFMKGPCHFFVPFSGGPSHFVLHQHRLPYPSTTRTLSMPPRTQAPSNLG